MKSEHKKILITFFEKPFMFLYRLEKEQIVAYLAGFQSAAGDDFDLTNRISARLRTAYQITKSNPGWPGQVQTYADMKGIDFFHALKEISMPFLLQNS
jgi:hypothetical protein